MKSNKPDSHEMDSIFQECRQCGACCKKYRKVLLHPDEVDFIRKMGGHVGVKVGLNDLRGKSMDELVEEAKKTGKVYMIHPDGKGCVFLEKRNGKYFCKIYHYRPRSCMGFHCTLADNSFKNLFADNTIHLLGLDRFGRPLPPKDDTSKENL